MSAKRLVVSQFVRTLQVRKGEPLRSDVNLSRRAFSDSGVQLWGWFSKMAIASISFSCAWTYSEKQRDSHPVCIILAVESPEPAIRRRPWSCVASETEKPLWFAFVVLEEVLESWDRVARSSFPKILFKRPGAASKAETSPFSMYCKLLPRDSRAIPFYALSSWPSDGRIISISGLPPIFLDDLNNGPGDGCRRFGSNRGGLFEVLQERAVEAVEDHEVRFAPKSSAFPFRARAFAQRECGTSRV